MNERELLYSLYGNYPPDEKYPNGQVHTVAPMRSWTEWGTGYGEGATAAKMSPLAIYQWAMETLLPGEMVRSGDMIALSRNGVIEFVTGHVVDPGRTTWIFHPGRILGYRVPHHMRELPAANLVRPPHYTTRGMRADIGFDLVQVVDHATGEHTWEAITGQATITTTLMPVQVALALRYLNSAINERFEVPSVWSQPTPGTPDEAYINALFKRGIYQQVTDPLVSSPATWLSAVQERNTIASAANDPAVPMPRPYHKPWQSRTTTVYDHSLLDTVGLQLAVDATLLEINRYLHALPEAWDSMEKKAEDYLHLVTLGKLYFSGPGRLR